MPGWPALAGGLLLLLSGAGAEVGGLVTLREVLQRAGGGQVHYGDPCSNECEEGNPRAWCGQRRMDPSGQVMHCEEGTKKGELCVDECSSKGENYYWCWTNAHRRGTATAAEQWNYCGINDGAGAYTVKGVRCTTPCTREQPPLDIGQGYWWCRDQAEDPSQWDYCSPPSQVRPVQFTRHGHACLGECGTHGEDYWWCRKSVRWQNEDDSDAWWEYCSPSNTTTRYNAPCSDECASRGETYFWCHAGGSWDYCSPSSETELLTTTGGNTCLGVCDSLSSGYNFCEVKRSTGAWWDYCTPRWVREESRPPGCPAMQDSTCALLMDSGKCHGGWRLEVAPGARTQLSYSYRNDADLVGVRPGCSLTLHTGRSWDGQRLHIPAGPEEWWILLASFAPDFDENVESLSCSCNL